MRQFGAKRKEPIWKVFEYTKKANMDGLTDSQKHFTAKMIVNEVKKIAKEKNLLLPREVQSFILPEEEL